MKVSVFCPGDNGQTIKYGETTTNFMGSYTMRFQGSPDLTNCVSQVSTTGQGCGAASGSSQAIRLVFRMFDMTMYSVNPLLSQPAQPMPYCLGSSTNPPAVKPPTPPFTSVPTPTPTIGQAPPVTTPPTSRMPPLTPLPPTPPVPFFQASTCSSRYFSLYLSYLSAFTVVHAYKNLASCNINCKFYLKKFFLMSRL